MMQQLKMRFKEIYHIDTHLHCFFSPGRVNLIGEHIDYNGGNVLPAAIDLGTYGVIRKRSDKHFRFYSSNFKKLGVIEVDMDDLSFQENHSWSNYVKGVIQACLDRGFTLDFGFDLYIESTLPIASGLSSSASIELLTIFACNTLYNLGLSRQKMALLSKKVENEYMGVSCGIMDQLIIAEGLDNQAILMDTNTLSLKPIETKLNGLTWVIMSTNYPRKMTDSKYNERYQECQDALKILKPHFGIQNLCEIRASKLDQALNLLKDETLKNRVRHVVLEHDRTIQAYRALEQKDAHTFCKLMIESHDSLKHDYEVSGEHLDTIVSAALEFGANGARMTGAGFGGCAIALLKSEDVDHIIEQTKKKYQEITHIEPSFYRVKFVEGVHEYACR